MSIFFHFFSAREGGRNQDQHGGRAQGMAAASRHQPGSISASARQQLGISQAASRQHPGPTNPARPGEDSAGRTPDEGRNRAPERRTRAGGATWRAPSLGRDSGAEEHTPTRRDGNPHKQTPYKIKYLKSSGFEGREYIKLSRPIGAPL